ncbi:FaeA-like protein [compost metagenome]|nr:FaeA/PapI family transcriptional regulator [Aeromonas media]
MVIEHIVKKSDVKKQNIYGALLTLCPAVEGNIPHYDDWPKTREIADACNETIYSARLYLLALADEGKIYCSYQNVNNSLRWYPRLCKAEWPDIDNVTLAPRK